MDAVIIPMPLRVPLALLSLLLPGVLARDIQAAMPSSTNYALVQYAFTGGNPNQAPTSTSYRLEASSMAGVSYRAITNATMVFYPGYLVPWEWTLATPELLGISLSNGEIWLTWGAVTNATQYSVQYADTLHLAFTNDPSGTYSNLTWRTPFPSASRRFYRVKATMNP